MKTLFGVLTALMLTLATVPAQAQTDGGTADEGTCLSVKVGSARAYAIFLHRIAQVVAQTGGSKLVESALSPDETKAAGQSISALYVYGAGSSKCLSLSKLQAFSLLKAVVTMSRYVDSRGLDEAVFKPLVDEYGIDNFKLMTREAGSVSQELARKAGLLKDTEGTL